MSRSTGGVRPMSASEGVYHSERCAGKCAYATRAKAVRAKRSHARRYGVRFRAYRCGFCGKWHLTTKHLAW